MTAIWEWGTQPQGPHTVRPRRPLLTSPPRCSSPGDLTRQLLDPVEKGVCRPPVQGLRAEQGHPPAGRAPSGLLPEGWKDTGQDVDRRMEAEV